MLENSTLFSWFHEFALFIENEYEHGCALQMVWSGWTELKVHKAQPMFTVQKKVAIITYYFENIVKQESIIDITKLKPQRLNNVITSKESSDKYHPETEI